MARSNYIIPREWLTDNTLSVDEWTFPATVHPAPFSTEPDRWNWQRTNTLANAQQRTFNAYDLINDVKISDDHRIVTYKGKDCEAGKVQTPLFCPVSWNTTDGNRRAASVEQLFCMVFDFDELTDDVMKETIDGFLDSGVCFVAYSSYSHKSDFKDGKGAIRVIVPLDEPLNAEDYNTNRQGVWYAFERIFPHLDKSTKDCSRFWFMPSARRDRPAWNEYQDGFMISTAAVLQAAFGAIPDQPLPAPLVLVPNEEDTQPSDDDGGGDDGGDDGNGGDNGGQANGNGGTQRRNLPRHIVRDDFEIKCHDGVVRTFGWVIENWNHLPKAANGRYQCYRYWRTTGHSNTLGSAYVSREMNTKHRIARYRCTWYPNEANIRQRANNDCDTTDFGIQVGYSNRAAQGFYPKQTVPSVVRMLEQMEIDLWQDARTGDAYFEGEAFEDRHYTVIQERFWRYYRVDANRNALITAIDSYCEMNQIDTLKTYLEDLTWDNVPRLETLFIKYLKAADTKINRAYGKRWAISCVARAMDWGCDMQSMVILKGEQGIRKSSFFRIIAGSCALTGRSYFNDQPIGTDGSTDSCSLLRKAWIHEWAELSGMSKRETGEVKQFISKPDDTYRAKYARKEKKHFRHSVMVGTVNDDEIFKDETGNRRFWAVECLAEKHTQAFDPKELEAERDQLWAEAVHLFKQGVPYHLQGDEVIDSAAANEKFESVDVHRVLVEEWLANNEGKIFRIQEMIEEIYMEEFEANTADGTEIRKRAKAIRPKSYINWYSAALKSMGCTMLNGGKKCRHANILSRWYVAPQLDTEDEVGTDDTTNGMQREVKFNADGTVKAVREFGKDWVFFEDMSQTVQEDWLQRYPPRSKPSPAEEQSTIPFPPKDGKGKFRFRM